MRRASVLLALSFLLFGCFQFVAADTPEQLPVFLKNPHLSPDGKLIAFDFEGDIWTVPIEGGNAKRLTVHLAYERRPYFSPDGKQILFAAAYYGNYDLYVMPAEGGKPRRLTFSPGNDVPSGWSHDGKYIYFYSFRDDLYDSFRMPAEGGTPSRIAYARRDYCVGPSPSPDGKYVAFNYRSGYQEWNRRGYVSPDTSEIYVGENTVPVSKMVRLTDNWNQDFLPLWAPDSKTLYFVNDERGTYDLYSTNGLKKSSAKRITKLNDMGIRWYTVASVSGDIVIEMNHRLHRLDPKSGETKLIPITFYDPPKVQQPEFAVQKVDITDFSVSPDCKKVAFITGHDIYVMAATGGYAKQLTNTADRESNITWAPDSNYVLCNRLVNDAMNIVRIDVRNGAEELIATGADNKYTPYYTPDGKAIAFQRDYEEICMMNPDGTNIRTIVKGVFARRLIGDGRWFDFTPDGKWMLYNENNEVMAYAALAKKIGDNSPAIDLSTLGGNNWPGAFTKDYRQFIYSNYFANRQTIYIVDFDKTLAPVKSDIEKLDELLNPPAKPKQPEKTDAPKDDTKPQDSKDKPAETPKAEEKKPEGPQPGDSFDLTNLIDKTRTLRPPIPMNQYFIHLMKDDKNAIIMGYNADNYVVYLANLAPDNTKPHVALTNTPGRKYGVEIDDNENFLYFLTDGALYSLNLKSREQKKISPDTVRKEVDEKAERRAVFQEILWLIKTGFYDPKLHGVDIVRLRAKYAPLVEKCSNDSIFRSLMDEFISEFNASHMGVGSKPGDAMMGMANETTPHLGFFYDDALAAQGIIRVSQLVKNTPAGLENSGIKVGDYVLEINGVKVGPGINVYECIRNMMGQEIKLVLSDSLESAETRTAYMKTIDINGMFQARLLDWENSNRRYVEQKSGGKLGYVFLASMMDPDYQKFVAHLSRYMARHDGVVLDFRYNSGGRISHMLTEVLDDQPWLFSRMRGGRWIPEDVHRDFSFQKAVVGLFNYRSFSNAEMMAAGFKLKEIGKTVGLPTAGGVIGTWPKTLLDGSEMRMPRFSIYDRNGRNLELSPTKPDFNVERDVIDEMAGRDPQLDKAIEVVTKEAKKNSARLMPKLPKGTQ